MIAGYIPGWAPDIEPGLANGGLARTARRSCRGLISPSHASSSSSSRFSIYPYSGATFLWSRSHKRQPLTVFTVSGTPFGCRTETWALGGMCLASQRIGATPKYAMLRLTDSRTAIFDAAVTASDGKARCRVPEATGYVFPIGGLSSFCRATAKRTL